MPELEAEGGVDHDAPYLPWSTLDKQPYELIKHALFDCLAGMYLALKRTDLREFDHTHEVWKWSKAVDALAQVYGDTYRRKQEEDEADL